MFCQTVGLSGDPKGEVENDEVVLESLIREKRGNGDQEKKEGVLSPKKNGMEGEEEEEGTKDLVVREVRL